MLPQQVAHRFELEMRGSDTVARLGGDEFAVLLPQAASVADAIAAAVRLHAAIEAEFLVEGLTMDVDATIGLAVYPEHAGDPDELLQRAEVAMYAAKTAHLDYAIYDAGLNQHSPRRLALHGQRVTHMRAQHKGDTIVRSTVDLAHDLGLKVVAEGVEDEETWPALNLLGCDAVQGYHLARPMSAGDLTAWLDLRQPTAAVHVEFGARF